MRETTARETVGACGGEKWRGLVLFGKEMKWKLKNHRVRDGAYQQEGRVKCDTPVP